MPVETGSGATDAAIQFAGVPGNSFTALGWFKNVNHAGYQGVINWGTPSGDWLGIWFDGAGGKTYQMDLYNNAETIDGWFVSAEDAWFFACIVRDDSRANELQAFGRLVNDTALTSSAQINAPLGTASELNFANSPFDELMPGDMGYVKVFDTALTEAQILAESYRIMPILIENVWSWIPAWSEFDTTDGTVTGDLLDYSGNGNHGPLASNSTQWAPIDNALGTNIPVGVAYGDSGILIPVVGTAGGGATTVQIGLVSETNTAQAFGRAKARSIGLNTETDLAQAFGSAKSLGIGLNVETDAAQAFGRAKNRAIGLLSESDQVFAMGTGGQRVAIGLVSEADAAQAFGSLKQRAIGLLTESDLAQSINAVKSRTLGLASEVGALFSLSSAKGRAIGLVSESDSVLAVSAQRAYDIGLVTETDAVFALSRAKARSIGLVTESDVALAMTASGPAVVSAILLRADLERLLLRASDDRLILFARNDIDVLRPLH